MKRIDINQVRSPNPTSVLACERFYRVILGNKRRVQFTSERDARQFQADTNRFLTALLHELNCLHAQAYMDYRMAWPMMFHRGASVQEAVETTARTAMDAGAAALDRAVRGTSGENAMHFAWKHLTDTASHCRDLYAALAGLYRYKTQGVWRYQMELRERQCLDVLRRLDQYGATP